MDDFIVVETRPMIVEDYLEMRRNMDRIIYAEWADPGAMGCCGTARVFYVNTEDDEPVEYVTDCGPRGEDGLFWEIKELMRDYSYETYHHRFEKMKSSPGYKMYTYAERHDDPAKCFAQAYGGVGNFVWKNMYAAFEDCEEHSGYFYRYNGKKYLIRTSVYGVYLESRDKMLLSPAKRPQGV